MNSAQPRFLITLGLALVVAGTGLGLFYLQQRPAHSNSKQTGADSRLVSDDQKIAEAEQRVFESVPEKKAAYEKAFAELNAAGADDSDIDKITWQNSCRFFGWDPFARTPREQASVGALRAKGFDVDVSIRPRKEWARLYRQKQLAGLS